METGDTPAPAGTAPLTLAQGQAKVASLLSPRPEPDKAPEKVSAPKDEDVREETDAPDPEASASDDEARSDDAPASPADRDEEPVKVRLKDGREVTLDEVEEWQKGHLRQSDYTRKTQELATTRKELEQRQAAFEEQSQAIEQYLNLAVQIAEAKMPPMPDPVMLDRSSEHYDPVGYSEQEAVYNLAVKEMAELQQAKRQQEQERIQQQRRSFDEWRENEKLTLLEKAPELRDPAKAQAFMSDVQTYLPEYGYTVKDLSGVHDHRPVLLMRDAIAYRKLKAAQPKAEAKAKDAPPVREPGPRAQPGETANKARRDDMAKLRRTGDRRLGEKILADMLKAAEKR